jgi:hypothetical protein
MRTLAAGIVALTLGAACGTEPELPPDGPHYQYVVSELHIASTNTEARQYGLDLNADGVTDNQLGMIFATLDSMGLGVDDTAREALLRGGLIVLADLQTPDFDDSEISGVRTYLGRDPIPAPCLDPAQLESCGQHLLGTGEFSVEDVSGSGLGTGPIIDGTFIAGMPRLPIQIAIISPTEPIRVVLHGARVRATNISPTGASAIIAGGITKADIDGVVIPEAAAQMDRIVGNECGQPDGVAPCGCPKNSRAKFLDGLFDANLDCTISTLEVANNSLAQSLLAPDLRLHGEDLLSFGVGVELASATFLPPPPEL